MKIVLPWLAELVEIPVGVAGLADTASLPASVGPKSSHLKVIK